MTVRPVFRSAGPADVEKVVSLVESAYRGEASRAGWTTEADLLDGQRADRAMVEGILATGALVLLAELDGDLVGCAQLEPRGVTAYFGMFAVRPDHQARGIGKAVLVEAERIAGEWGSAAVEMSVLSQRTDLLAWYRRRGYRATGEIRPFPYGDERFGIPRRADLSFTVLVKSLA